LIVTVDDFGLSVPVSPRVADAVRAIGAERIAFRDLAHAR
jgi:hypothetical protein